MDAIAAVAAHAGGQQAGLPSRRLDGKDIEGHPGDGQRADAEGDGTGDGFVVFQDLQVPAEEVVVDVVLFAGGYGEVPGVQFPLVVQ